MESESTWEQHGFMTITNWLWLWGTHQRHTDFRKNYGKMRLPAISKKGILFVCQFITLVTTE